MKIFLPLKKILKLILPNYFIFLYRDHIHTKSIRTLDKKFNGVSNKNIFSTIYKEKLWGTIKSFDRDGNENLPMSGHGSHDKRYTKPYIEAITEVFNTSKIPIKVLDVGCGDFFIGKDLVKMTESYIGADIVPEVIKSISATYKDLNVNFISIDCTRDKLPNSNFLLLRQVLQHLSNKDIIDFLANLQRSKTKYLILTELIPSNNFVPNLDSKTGVFSRLSRGINSGVVLEESPFDFKYLERQELLKIRSDGGYLQTILYKLS